MGENSGLKKRVLIAGGSGLIGLALAGRLRELKYDVAMLSRNIHSVKEYKCYFWDVVKNEIELDAFDNVHCIINLAGENISNRRWTVDQKKKIEDSRVKSAELIFEAVQKLEIKPETYISSSATGIYGSTTSEKIYTETDEAASDFLAGICLRWEDAAIRFQSAGIRTAILRTGVVFSNQAGAFPKLIQTLKFGFISAIGSGKQYMPWIHIDDLVKMYVFAIENKDISGIFNAVAPEHITQTELVSKTRNIYRRQLKTPNIPAFLLKIIFGEMASILLYGSRVSADKISKTGFEFYYPNIDLALKSLLIIPR
jgi:uncharacterized protein (TIGR01777 family)